MINALTGLGYGILGLAIMIGIGLVILASLETNISSCSTGFNYSITDGLCQNNTNASHTVNPSVGSQNIHTVSTYLGTSNGGLASWIPIVIVLVIGMLFLGAFLTRKGKRV